MAKKTLKQLNLELLRSKGWTVDENSRVSRYTVMTKPGVDYRYFLSNAGAVRRGKTVTGSISVKLRTEAQQPRNPSTKVKMTAQQFADAIDAAAETKDKLNEYVDQLQFVLSEAGTEIGRFATIAEAKQELQNTWGEGQPLEWKRSTDGDRRLIHEQFTIHSVRKDAKPEAEQRPDPTAPTAETPAKTPTTRPGSTTADTAAAPSPGGSGASGSLAAVLSESAEAEREKRASDVVAGYKPTDEQRAVLDAAATPGLRCLVLPAGAGAGKTSTLRMLEETLPGSGQYTAFNKSLVAESKSKFRKARCSTTHGLAFGTVGKAFSHRLNSARMRSDQVAARLGISDLSIAVGADAEGKPTVRNLQAGWLAGQVMMAIRRFCQSADERIGRQHFKRIEGIDAGHDELGRAVWANNDVVRDYLLPFAEKAWADLSSPTGSLPFSHDVYVKVWQLGRGPNKPVIPADYILLDEAQDTAPVFLDVLKQQTHALLIFVGDSNQAIYEWRGAVDAMAAFPDAPRRMLSQSFRFGQRVADVANSILAGLDEPTDLVLKGLETIPSVVALDRPFDRPKCVLTRTNAAAVSAVMEAQAAGRTTHLIASVDEVLAFVRAARDLQAGKPTSHPDLGCFSKWAEVVEYSKTDEGQDLRLWVKLIEEFSVAKIIAALEAQTPEEQADLVVCTAHKSKGREWVSVKLAGDFPPACKMSDPDRKLLYVAATRAKLVLDLSGCPPFHMFRDKVTGEETPGIKIKFTGPMPEVRDVDSMAAEAPAKPAETPQDKPTNGNGHAQAKEFNWSNYNGKWCVGGPPGHAGQTVEVVRKSGSRSRERLGRIVKEFSDRTIYSLDR